MSLHGLAKNPHLIAAAATADPERRGEWTQISEEALAAAGGSTGRTLGTALHQASERADRGEDLTNLPKEVRDDAGAYLKTLENYDLVPITSELFVANQELRCAGSMDRLVTHRPSGRVAVLDLKTSKNEKTHDYQKLAWSIQLSVYANSVPYCDDQGFLTWESVGIDEPQQESGLVFHLIPGTGKVRVHKIDLAKGYEYAKLAVAVKEARKDGSLLEEI